RTDHRAEPVVAQVPSGLASDVEATDAERDHWRALREFSDPFVDALGITPHRALHHALRPAAVVARSGVDDLHRRARLKHRLDLVDRDRWQVGELLLLEGAWRLHRQRILITALRRAPIDIAHERGDIGLRLAPEIQL